MMRHLFIAALCLAGAGPAWSLEGDDGGSAGQEASRKEPASAAVQGAAYGHEPLAGIPALRIIAKTGTPSERFSAWETMTRLFEKAGRLNDAIAAQEALLALMGPGHWKLAAARQRLLYLHRQAGTLDALEKTWEAQAADQPRNPEWMLRMADLEKFQGNAVQRLAWLRKAVAVLPKDTSLACEAAELELSLGHPKEAGVLYDAVLALHPHDEDVLFLRAETLVLSGRTAEAEKRIEAFRTARKGDENARERALEFYRRMRLAAPLERTLAARLEDRRTDEGAAVDLAGFYLQQRRYADAVAALAHFDDSGLSPKDAAATAFRFSELLSAAQLNAGALTWVRRAFDKEPGNPEYALSLAGALAVQNHPAAERKILEKAIASAKSPLPREDLDRRLFLVLQAEDEAGPESRAGKNEAVRRKLEVLEKQAKMENAAVADWLRLARWRRWAGDPAGGLAALRRGLARNPNSTGMREALISALANSGETAQAVEELRQLAKLQPERSLEIRRRIGHLQLGDTQTIEDGLTTFETLWENHPGDWRAAADFALAQQITGNGFGAFEMWERAYKMAPPDARPGLRAPILNAAAHLQLQDRALSFLEEACLSTRDEAGRDEILREAAAFAVENHLAANWRARLESRQKSSPADGFWDRGRIFLLKAEGRDGDARKALKVSIRNENESAESLRLLLAAADHAKDWAQAAALTKRLLVIEHNRDPALARRRADYLERAGKWDAAERAWSTIAVRQARSPEALVAAADFFERTGDDARMAALYRAASRFADCAPQVRLRLGRLALERGDRNQALDDFQAVLDCSRPDAAADRKRSSDCPPLPERILQSQKNPAAEVSFLPGGSRTAVRAPVHWSRADETKTAGCRLLAIQAAGRLRVNSPDKEQWLHGFSSPMERIWAAYYSGETRVAFDAMKKLTEERDARDADPAIAQAFAALAMESGHVTELGAWAAGDPDVSDARWNHVLAALARMLDADWRPSENSMVRLFAPASALQRWQAARAFAAHKKFRIACNLGADVPNQMPPPLALAAWLEMSDWRIAARDPERAVLCLDRAIACAPAAVSYANPLFAAIRARWLLTPPDARDAFEDRLTARCSAMKDADSAVAVRALLAALRGDSETACRELEGLKIRAGAFEEERWPEIVIVGGAQLERWNLPRLARVLYRKDMARDPALRVLRGETRGKPVEDILILSLLSSASKTSAPYYLNEWLARNPSDEQLLHAVAHLYKAGRIDIATEIFTTLCRRNPRNEAVCLEISNLAGHPPFRQAGIAFLDRLLADSSAHTSRVLARTAALRLSGLLKERGDAVRALALLDRLDDQNAPNEALLLNQVDLLCRLGRFREAMDKLEKNKPQSAAGSETASSLTLAKLYSAFGRDAEARAIREKESAPPAGETPADGNSSDPEDLKKSLRALDQYAARPAGRFRAGRDFLIQHRDLDESLRRSELDRLRKIAAKDTALLPNYYLLRKDLATSPAARAALEGDLAAEWNSGRGSYLAGEILIRLFLEQKRFQDLDHLLDGYLTDRNFNEQAWDQIGRRLLRLNQPAMAVRVLAALMARAPGDTDRALFLAAALWKSDRRAVAREVVAPIRRIAALDPRRHLDLAQFALSLDRPNMAKQHLAAVADLLPGNPQTVGLWAVTASEFIAQKQFVDAREALICAIEKSRTCEVPEAGKTPVAPILADYYRGVGDLDRVKPDANEFHLTEWQLGEFQLEMARRLVADGNLARAWDWLGEGRVRLRDSRWRNVLQALESSDWERTSKIWAVAAQSPLWEVRVAAAQFHLRHAQAFPAAKSVVTELARAHELHPGSMAIAKVYVEELLRLQKPVAARKALQEVLDSYSTAADRREAHRMLAALKISSALPNPE